MAIIYGPEQSVRGTDIVVVDVSGSGGSNYKRYSPSYIRVVEIEHDTDYYSIRGKNVIRQICSYEYNYFGGRGPRSWYGKCVDKAIAVAEKALVSDPVESAA